MKEIFSNEQYKVLQVNLNAGERMPLHKASSDAFVIPQSGKAKLSFDDHDEILAPQSTILIKANKPHKMEIIEDFCSCIILEKKANIQFITA